MKVYVVVAVDWEYWEIMGLFKAEKDANDFADSFNNSSHSKWGIKYRVEEHELQ